MQALHQYRRWLVATLVVAALGGSGVAIAAGAGHGHGHGHWKFDPAKATKHIDMMVEHVLPDGTVQEKVRLKEIAEACYKDVQPIQQKMRAGHDAVSKGLLVPAIDRAALEVLRAENAKQMDLLSRRVLLAAMDAADVLTVEQRKMFNTGLHMMALSHMSHAR